MKHKIPALVMAVIIFAASYAVFAQGEGPQHDNPGLDPDRPEGPAATPGVVRTAEKSFVVKKSTTVSASSVRVISPNGGEVMEIGKTYKISWLFNNLPSAGDVIIGIFVYDNDLKFPVVSIADSNPGEFEWTVPADIKPGNYRISVEDCVVVPSSACYEDSSDASFSIIRSVASQQASQETKAETKTESRDLTEAKICNDCDTQGGTGVSFQISSGVSVLNMLVCNAGATEKECRESASAGIDNPLICESFAKNACDAKCFNAKGKYYVLVQGFRGLFDSVAERDGDYDYECPGLSTEPLAKTKENLLQLQLKVSATLAKVQLLLSNADDDETKAKYSKYDETLKKIQSRIDGHLKEIDAALANPEQDAIARAVAKTDDLKKDVLDLLNALQ